MSNHSSSSRGLLAVAVLALVSACHASPTATTSCCAPADATATAAPAGTPAPVVPVAAWTSVALTDDAWHVAGTVADACQCTVFCPCEFQSLPSAGCCDDTALIHIDSGAFGGVALDGLDLVVVSESPAGQRMIDHVGDLVFARVYVGAHASDAQAAVAAEIARRLLGTWVKDANRLSADERAGKVELVATMAATRAMAKIPGILDLAMETNVGGDGATPVVLKNSPWSAPGIGDVRVAHSTVYDYRAEGRAWHYGGRSASFRNFDVGGKVSDKPK